MSAIAPSASKSSRRSALGLVAKHWSTVGTPAVLVGLCVYFAIASPAFATLGNVTTVLQRESVVAIAALGATMVILSGGIDLTMGVVIGLSSIAVTMPMFHLGYPAWLAILIGLAAGIVVGALTGMAVVLWRVPPLIATLGMLLIVKGFAAIVSNNETVSGSGLPPWFTALGRSSIGPVPFAVLILGVLYLVAHLVMTRTRFGVHTYAIGSDEDSARLAGIGVDRHKIILYAVSGLLSAMAGVLLVSRLGSGYALHGQGWEFEIVAAILVGGTSIFGGRGSVLRTLIGVAMIGVLSNGLNLLGVSSFYQNLATGVLLIGAVALSELDGSRLTASSKET